MRKLVLVKFVQTCNLQTEVCDFVHICSKAVVATLSLGTRAQGPFGALAQCFGELYHCAPHLAPADWLKLLR